MTEHRLFTHNAFPTQVPIAMHFTPGTLIDTPDGAREVERLAVGDMVSTRDGALRILRVEALRRVRADWAYDRSRWAVRVPVGSLGNTRPMRLSQGQRVLLSGATVAGVCGVEEISVGLGDLVGLRGLIVARPLAELRYHGLSFGMPAIVAAEGVPCEVECNERSIVTREVARSAYQAMHAAGEPKLRL